MKFLNRNEMLQKLEELYPVILKTSTVIKSSTNKNNIRFAFDSYGNLFYLVNKLKRSKQYGFGDIYAYKIELINGKYFEIKIGSLSYLYDKTIKISAKALTIRDNFVNNDYQNKSVGSYWLKFCEEISNRLSLNEIGGDFCPHNGMTEENLKKFYEKNGYIIDEKNKTISKKLNNNEMEIIKENEPCFKGYKIYDSITKLAKQQDLAQGI